MTSSRGSVMLEFIMVLPIYLLLFGATFLLFELSLARIHLLEANRNLAWLAGDRYAKPGSPIQQRTGEAVREYFEERNRLENRLAPTAEMLYECGDTDNWKPLEDGKFSEGTGDAAVSLDVNGKLAGFLPANRWCGLYSGNLELKMKRISAAYIGAIAVGDVLHGSEKGHEFFRASYDLTRAGQPANGEALLLHRDDADQYRAGIDTASLDLTRLVLEGWPVGDGDLQSAILDLMDKAVNDVGSKVGLSW
ncbi:MAG: hypothetical protein II943_11685 [Victivallales bacterium]|nr:hypothetical protein [Victivallales bacterium]